MGRKKVAQSRDDFWFTLLLMMIRNSIFTKGQKKILLDLYYEILLEMLSSWHDSIDDIKDDFPNPQLLTVWEDIDNIKEALKCQEIDIDDLDISQGRIEVIVNILAACNKQAILGFDKK